MGNEFEKTIDSNSLDIAVIGMACNFPQAQNTDRFWENLCNGIETVKFFTDEELIAQGVSPELLKNPNYVKAASVLDNQEVFDAEFFDITPNEAKCMDPQHRVFMECCWEAFENAGYDPGSYDGDIGVFAGLGMNTYMFEVLVKNPDFYQSISREQIMIGNDKDFLPTLVSYKLNLKGPSVNVNTACSTSLVSIHLARHSLLLGECDMALAGGVSILLHSGKGYMYVKDGLQSPDGHCHAFDARAKGTIFGDGCGVVLLKRLADALEDGDHIYAVIKGSAVNNDGSQKAGYTAPGVEGQSKVIVEALTVAGLSPGQINYVETHGTGTQLGDPIEITALTQAFRSGTERKNFCPIGSVKTNIGHLNAAAGAAGFIKTVLAIQNKKLPPSLNFENANPQIDFAGSPFYVNTKLAGWSNGSEPLRAGISAMGIGGTNCHIIIEEAPRLSETKAKHAPTAEYILVLSARSAQALEDATRNLADYLEAHPEVSLKDVAYTLQCGRRAFAHRRALRCNTVQDAVNILRSRNPEVLFEGKSPAVNDRAVLKSPLLESWLNGETVDWSSMWRDLSPNRVPLPTYPFERKRFWVDPKAPVSFENESPNNGRYFEKMNDMADWFYVPSWRQSTLPFTAPRSGSKCCLLFADPFQIGDSIARKLTEEGDTVIIATMGKSYKQKNGASFVLNPADPTGFQRMFNALENSNQLPDRILFFWSLETVQENPIEFTLNTLISTQQSGFFSILYSVKALAGLTVKKVVELIAFTNNTFDIIGNEAINVHAATIYGMCLVMRQEYDNFRCRMVDIMLPEPGSAEHEPMIEMLMNEIGHETSELLCAYRNAKRFIRKYEPLRVERDAPLYHSIRKAGVYLVYGGMEGIGFLISQYIGRDIGAKLLLLEEEGFPDQADWDQWLADHEHDHPVSRKIRNALTLLENGAEYIGTISNPPENERLFTEIEQRTGKISGVIHAPGASNAKRFKEIKNTTPETWSEHLQSVGYSLMTLDHAFRNKELDFRIMLNSLGSVLGGNGFINIATVSNYTKAYLTKQNRINMQPWIVQCWDSWVIEWEQFRNSMPSDVYQSVEPSVLTHEEGIACFQRAFAARNVTELDISATNLHNRYNRWVTMNSLPEPEAKETEIHSRPDLDTAYLAPQTPTERSLEGIFRDLFGIEKVGVNDDFFELGGHSLLGIHLVSKIRNAYSAELDLGIIYKYPTIASLAAYLDSRA